MNATTALANHDLWPELPLEAWQDTLSTLHMWTQIVGKVRLALSPNINHWWGVPLYVNAMGLTTSRHPLRRRKLRGSVRFHPSSTRHSNQQRRDPCAGPCAALRRGFLSGIHGRFGFPWNRGKNLEDAGRDSRPDSV